MEQAHKNRRRPSNRVLGAGVESGKWGGFLKQTEMCRVGQGQLFSAISTKKLIGPAMVQSSGVRRDQKSRGRAKEKEAGSRELLGLRLSSAIPIL